MLKNVISNMIICSIWNGIVIIASGKAPTPGATYKIKDITLEYEIVTQLDLAKVFQKNTKAWSQASYGKGRNYF